ncbi:MAG: 50S ribosomal protein L3, partial [Candidatus Wallbacteria bacterium]|nr:50S ribosomal protein L3 [Candidatus Wallbacteria bacterium]
PVIQVKTQKTDGYEAVQVGFDELTKKKLPRCVKERFAKLNVPPQRVLHEFKPLEAGKLPAVGTVLNVKVFEKAKTVRVTGTSKGKGFQGVVRRHGFAGGSRTHGSNFHRAPGSVGNRTTPGEVHRGKRMGGHMGHAQVTLRDVTVMKVDPDKNLLYVRGAVPGPINGFVTVVLG